jgi:hypothetical protein
MTLSYLDHLFNVACRVAVEMAIFQGLFLFCEPHVSRWMKRKPKSNEPPAPTVRAEKRE